MWGFSHGKNSFMNSNMSPSHRLQSFINFSRVSASHGVQSFRKSVHHCESSIASESREVILPLYLALVRRRELSPVLSSGLLSAKETWCSWSRSSRG